MSRRVVRERYLKVATLLAESANNSKLVLVMDPSAPPKVVVYPAEESSPVLSDVEVRVLGALIEKQITTPDYYPLTLNALVNACNQTTSRDPVVHYDESTVTRALEQLRDKRLAFVFSGADSRVLRYGHKFTERFDLAPAEVAALDLLLLRGPQTSGEIRTRAGRLHTFDSPAEVEATLAALAAKTPHPLVIRLPRQSGLKESRYAHLLSGPPEIAPASDTPAAPVPTSGDRTTALEQEVATLRQQLAELRQQFADFRRQFE